MTGTSEPSSAVTPVEDHWRDVVAVALLGTDRRDPPAAPPAIADVVADLASASPSERMLAQVATTAAIRRAGVLPLPPRARSTPPPHDDRPPCPPQATRCFRDLLARWPLLEDEWLIAVIVNGWRVAPELVPVLLARTRRDPHRRARVALAAGGLVDWLVEHVPELTVAPTSSVSTAAPVSPPGSASERTSASPPPLDVGAGPELLALPALPIPPDLAGLIGQPGSTVADVLADRLVGGELGPAHRSVLVNLLARVDPDGLVTVTERLRGLVAARDAALLAASLAGLAELRHQMLIALRPAAD